jgi:hypothetical protein
MSYKSQSKYINLKNDGRIFPSWVLLNYRKYEIPTIKLNPDEDPCAKKAKLALRQYQLFISAFLDYRGPYRDLLLFHGLGSGKTGAAINVINQLFLFSTGWNVFVLLKATLKKSVWYPELEKWLTKDDNYKDKLSSIKFCSYDSPVADKNFIEILKQSDTSKKNIYIFEEAHNFIRNVYSNISSGKGRRAQTIYDYIIADKKDNDSTRVLLLTGSPLINKPFEIALLFNLLRPGIFPKSESAFNQLFVSNSGSPTINYVNKNLFQRRIMGLVSYYVGATPDVFATQKTHYINVEMSQHQDDIYDYFEKIEDKIFKQKVQSGASAETYMTYTRQVSNFVFGSINQNVTSEGRPRPGKFKLSEKEAEEVTTGKLNKLQTEKKEKNAVKLLNAQRYIKALNIYRDAYNTYLQEKINKDNKAQHTIMDDFKLYSGTYDNDFDKFVKTEKHKSFLFEALYNSSAKFLSSIFIILNSPGPVLVYSNYVMMEGLEIFSVYLKCFGFELYNETNTLNETPKFIEYHGGIDEDKRRENMIAFNNPDNKYGKIITVMLVSPAGTEGLSLLNVRQVHLIEPYWNEVRMIQMIGRAVRTCSHGDLPMKERHVDIYRYISLRIDKNKTTADQIINNLAQKKEELIKTFYTAIKEVAIDCNLNKSVNMLSGEYKCFQFDEPSLYEEQIGPAYKEDILDDMKINNGSNSINSSNIRIKVKKIKAVTQLNEEGTLFSKVELYWYNTDTKNIYDYQLYFAIGKLSVDDDGILRKKDKGTYIIDKLISIPSIN